MRTIAVEEHFTTPAFVDGPGRGFRDGMVRSGGAGAEKIFAELNDVGAGRIAAMDESGLDMQVLSLNYPGTEQSEADEAIAIARDAKQSPSPQRITAACFVRTTSPPLRFAAAGDQSVLQFLIVSNNSARS